MTTQIENKVVHDADLALVDVTQHVSGVVQAYGMCYNDTKGRFLDGDMITTSYIVCVFHSDGVLYIKTRNTIYRVISLINEAGEVSKELVESN